MSCHWRNRSAPPLAGRGGRPQTLEDRVLFTPWTGSDSGRSLPAVTFPVALALVVTAAMLINLYAAPPAVNPRPLAAPAKVTWSQHRAPILLVTDDGFASYLPEILRAEGVNGAFVEADAGDLDNSLLDLRGYRVVVLGAIRVSDTQARRLAAWVQAGGTLIAMRPGDNVATLAGLGPVAGTLSEAYLRLDTSTPPADGIDPGPLQYHGSADLRAARAGTRTVGTLHRAADAAGTYPAVTRRVSGPRGGQVYAFLYDLPRSVVLTRQGNPAWAGQNRDYTLTPAGGKLCLHDCRMRSDDLFVGAATADTPPAWTGSWVDPARNEVPQADLQQRLLLNMLQTAMPLPRLWYLPTHESGTAGLLTAAVVLTGDDHNAAQAQTRARFTAELNHPRQPPGCGQRGTAVDPAVLAAWRCLRSTSYAYAGALPDSVAAWFARQGFEIAPHTAGRDGTCPDNWRTGTEFERILRADLAGWFSWYSATAAVQPPATQRIHCVQWNDWVSVAQVSARYGMGMDTNYYQWPQEVFGARPGLMTGTGLPQRFADANGRPIPSWQVTTQVTDEAPGTNTAAFMRRLLDNASGPRGWYAVVTANEHLDNFPESNQGYADVLAVTAATGVPVITARQLLDWQNGRAAATLRDVRVAPAAVSWNLADPPRHAMQLVPARWRGQPLRLTGPRGEPVRAPVRTINGLPYALVGDAPGGAYTATYGPAGSTAPPPADTGTSLAPGVPPASPGSSPNATVTRAGRSTRRG